MMMLKQIQQSTTKTWIATHVLLDGGVRKQDYLLALSAWRAKLLEVHCPTKTEILPTTAFPALRAPTLLILPVLPAKTVSRDSIRRKVALPHA